MQATPLLQPPYSLDLNDYQGPASKLRVQLLLRDLTKPSLEVYISLRLSGFGVELQTNPSVAALNTFVLQPGVPLTISGSELSPLFAQMIAQGVDYDELLAGASLPGGYYTWEVVAYLPDGRQVSNTGRASMSVFKAQPPQITFPAHQATVAATGISTIPFQWLSRSVSPASVLGTIYDMKIYELPDEVTDPNVAVLSGLLPVFNTQTASTSYFYGPGDPLLIPGKRYAIVVQAQDIGGGDSYENQGLSQVVAFKVAGEPDATAQAACPTPTGLNIRQDDAQTLEVSWNPVAEATDYLLQFRKAKEPWQSQTTTDNGLMLIQLSPAKYEVQVATRCNGGLVSNVSPIVNYEIGIAPKDSTEDEIEDILSYYNEDPETPEPEEYEEPAEEDGLDILKTPFTLLLDTDALPDSLKANLPPGGSLPTLPENPTIEQLKDAVKARKTTCAAVIAGYTCGNHDAASPPSGDDYQPQPGDELAMNSIKIEVVEIDAAGNGLGIAHIKGFNNAKLGVELKGIKVKEGGCIYAGQAITNSVDLAFLNEKQRAALAQAYAIYNKALDKIEANADGMAETINGFLDGLQKAKQKAQALNAKIAAGQTPTEAEVKTLAKLEDQNLKTMTAAIDQLKKKYKDDINTEALALMEGYMADKRAAATALASYKPSMGPPPAAILQATANSQPELIEKTLKSVGTLEVEYNGRKYNNGQIIILTNTEDVSSFSLKNTVEGEPLSWIIKKEGTVLHNFTANPIGLAWPESTTELKVEATQGDRKINLILKRKTFLFKELYAVDANNTARKAKTGEKLYLVGKSFNGAALVTNTSFQQRKVNYVIESNADKTDIPSLDSKWDFFTMDSRGIAIEQQENIAVSGLSTSKTYSKFVKDGYFATMAEFAGTFKNAEVKVVDEDRERIDYTEKASSLLVAFERLTGTYKKIKTWFPCEFNIMSSKELSDLVKAKQLKIAAETFKEENKGDPKYIEVKQIDFSATGFDLASFKCEKKFEIPIPFTSYTIPLAKAGIEISTGLKGGLKAREDTDPFTKKKSYGKSNVYGGGYFKPKVYAGAVGVAANIEIEAGMQFRYPYEENRNKMGIVFYSSDTFCYLDVDKDVSIFLTKNFRYELFKLNTKTKFSIYEMDF